MGANDSKEIGKHSESEEKQTLFDWSKADFVKELESDKYGNAKLFRFDIGGNIEHCMIVERIAQEKGEFNVVYREAMRRKIQFANCPYLVQCLEVIKSKEDEYCGQFFKVQARFEFISQTLEDEINNKKKAKLAFLEKEITQVIFQVAQAIQFLRNEGVYHQRIQPKMIFISKDGICKLSDLTLFTGVEASTEYVSFFYEINKQCYLSPELLKALHHRQIIPEHNIEKSQIFSLGLCALEMALRESIQQIFDFQEFVVLQSELEKLLNQAKNIYSPKLFDLLSSMLSLDPSNRINIEEAISRLSVQQLTKSEDNQHNNSTTTRRSCVQKSPFYQWERKPQQNSEDDQQEILKIQTSPFHDEGFMPNLNSDKSEEIVQKYQPKKGRENDNILDLKPISKYDHSKNTFLPSWEQKNSRYTRSIDPPSVQPFQHNLEQHYGLFQIPEFKLQEPIHPILLQDSTTNSNESNYLQNYHNNKNHNHEMNQQISIQLPQPTQKHQPFAFKHQENDSPQKLNHIIHPRTSQPKGDSPQVDQIDIQQVQQEPQYDQKHKEFYESHKHCPRDILSLQQTLQKTSYSNLLIHSPPQKNLINVLTDLDESLQIQKNKLKKQSSSPYSLKYLPAIAKSPVRNAFFQQRSEQNTEEGRFTKTTGAGSTQMSITQTPKSISKTREKVTGGGYFKNKFQQKQNIQNLSPQNNEGFSKHSNNKIDYSPYLRSNNSYHDLNKTDMSMLSNYELQDIRIPIKRQTIKESCFEDELDILQDRINLIDLSLSSSSQRYQKYPQSANYCQKKISPSRVNSSYRHNHLHQNNETSQRDYRISYRNQDYTNLNKGILSHSKKQTSS